MGKLQNLLQNHSKLTVDNQNDNFEKAKQLISENPKVDKDGNVQKHKKRNFTQKEKEEIWEESKEYKPFDKDLLRVDIMGNVIAKNVLRIDPVRNLLAGEYEHIESHSQGGETKVENACLLQAGINHIKREKPLYELTRKEYIELKNNFGVKPKDLLRGLENNYDNTCKKFNVVFEKKGKKWAPVVLAKTKGGKNIYKPYYVDESDFYYKSFLSENEKDKLDEENYKKLDEFYHFKESKETTEESKETTEESKETTEESKETTEETSSFFEKVYAGITSLSFIQVAVGVVVIGGICYGSYKIYQYYQDKKKQKEIYLKYQENINHEKENLIKFIESGNVIEEELVVNGDVVEEDERELIYSVRKKTTYLS
jgi:hypothetical protein